MAKCKVCKVNIPDGTEYCGDCQDKKSISTNESYLDSLLSSVKNSTPTSESIYKKRNNPETNTNADSNTNTNTNSNTNTNTYNKPISPEPGLSKTQESDLQDYVSYNVDLGDINDFDQFFMENDLEDLQSDIIIGNEELFGKDIADLLSDDLENRQSIKKPVEDKPHSETICQPEEEPVSDYFDQKDMNIKNTNIKKTNIKDTNSNDTNSNEANSNDANSVEENFVNEEELQPEEIVFPDEDIKETAEDGEEINEEVYFSDEDQPENVEEEDIPADNLDDIITQNEFTEAEPEEDYDTDLNDLLNSLDSFQSAIPGATYNEEEEPQPSMEMEFESAENEEFEQIEQEEDDFLSLLNQISSDDPVAGDVKAINDLLSGATKPQKAESKPSSVGEVFSDALKVVTSLNDNDEQAILDKIPDAKGKKEKKKKIKKAKKSKKGKTDSDTEQPKKGFFRNLFGNIKDDKTLAASKKQNSLKSSTDESTMKETEKKGKGKKGKKGAPQATEEDEFESGRGGKGKAAEGKEKKKDKQEKKKKTKEIIQVIDEIEEDEGRINRLGAAIVFIFFGLLVALLLVGTNMVSYTLSIQNATNYFDKQKYTEAYNEVYGMEINDEDIEIYDKIMTVMFVNKQLNSYNSYYSLGMYPEALDSLLKGLKRYDKYIELATMLGIKTDLDYVRFQIIAELNNEFQLSEEEALRINAYDDMNVYSLEVYNVVLENISH